LYKLNAQLLDIGAYGTAIGSDDDEIRLFNDASISKMICVKTADMYTVYIIAKDMIVVNIRTIGSDSRIGHKYP